MKTPPTAPLRTPPPRVAMPGRAVAVPEVEKLAEPVDPVGTPEGPEQPEKRSRVRPLLVALALWLIAIGLGVVATLLFLGREETASPEEVDEAIDEVVSNTTVAPDLGPAIYGTVIQSVVFVQVGDDSDANASIGTGVVVNADGTILTSFHVVDDGAPIRVTFADGTQASATVGATQPENDIATLVPDQLPQPLVPAALAGPVPIGADVFAIGNPLGLGGSFSEGVVSGLNRTLPLEDGSELSNLIQFDAAVNPGSSGGPLVNANGQVVGIVTALVNPTGSDFFAGIGFAVPIDIAGGAAGGPEQ